MIFRINATKTVSKAVIGMLVYYGELMNRSDTIFPSMLSIWRVNGGYQILLHKLVYHHLFQELMEVQFTFWALNLNTFQFMYS